MDLEIGGKLTRIRQMLVQCGYDGVIIRSQTNLSWLTSGRFFINITSVEGVACIWIGLQNIILISNNIEAERLWKEEQVVEVCDELLVYPWYEESHEKSILDSLSEGLRVCTDYDLISNFRELRLKLTEPELERYKVLGQLAVDALESVAFEFKQGETEQQVAARVASACIERGLEPIVCLIGGDERALRRRHPLPTMNCIEKYAMLVLGARKWGLIASVSRAVHFGRIPSDLMLKQRAVIQVDGALLAATQPGKSLGEVFQAGVEAYSKEGFRNEWMFHHQGGLAGYASREIKAAPDSSEIIEVGQAVAWNPTIQGTKSEDTFVVYPEGLRNITKSANFPIETVDVGGTKFERPMILER